MADMQCSWWPDEWFGQSLTDCCIAHDLGGTDIALAACVAGQGGVEFAILSGVMLIGLALFRPIYRVLQKRK